jgi:hypothetical protein
MIRFRCPGCHSRINARPTHAGRSIKCPACGQPLTVPTNEEAETAQQPDESTSAAESHDDFPDLQEFVREEAIGELPPAPVRKARKPQPEEKGARTSRPVGGAKCGGCGKEMSPDQRFCVACGFNNFDADVAAVEAHFKLANRLDHLADKLFFLRWLRVFARLLR